MYLARNSLAAGPAENWIAHDLLVGRALFDHLSNLLLGQIHLDHLPDESVALTSLLL